MFLFELGDVSGAKQNSRGDGAYTRDGSLEPSRKQRVRRKQLPKGAFFMPPIHLENDNETEEKMR